MKKIMSILVILTIGILLSSGIGIAGLPCMYTNFENNSPGRPKITGPDIVHGPGPHEYTFKAIDPDGDNISYQIDWADGDISEWTDWYMSDEEISRSHIYNDKETYQIKARAKDIHGAIGDWGVFYLTVSKRTQINNLIFFRLEKTKYMKFKIL